jgi:hypothetical protein
MSMSVSQASAVSEFTKRSEFSTGSSATNSSDGSPRNAGNLTTRAWSRLGKLVPLAFVRFLIAFFIGVAATLGWQSYGSLARETVAGWSPHLGWLAPSAAPAVASGEQRKATSLALAAVRQSVDKLASEIAKLQQVQVAPDKTSASSPSRTGSRRQ